MTKILLIDDDRELTAMLAEYLAGEGLGAFAVHDGQSGETEALSGRYDLVVLDVMLPRLSGIEVLRRIRRTSDVPVLLLTARGDDIDRTRSRRGRLRPKAVFGGRTGGADARDPATGHQ